MSTDTWTQTSLHKNNRKFVLKVFWIFVQDPEFMY